MQGGGFQMDGFYLVIEFHWGGFATNEAILSSFNYLGLISFT